eukprot:1511591-Pyramimonas_sp.AAC.1
MHYLGVFFVNVVMLQPNGRTTGLPSYFNPQVNFDSLHEHHNEDLPHIQFCGKDAILQNDVRQFYLQEQPVGIWVDQIPLWTTLAKRKGTCKVNLDQYTTRLRDSHGVLL